MQHDNFCSRFIHPRIAPPSAREVAREAAMRTHLRISVSRDSEGFPATPAHQEPSASVRSVRFSVDPAVDVSASCDFGAPSFSSSRADAVVTPTSSRDVSPSSSRRRPKRPDETTPKYTMWRATRHTAAAPPAVRYRTIGDSVAGCLMSKQRPMTRDEQYMDWKRICALRSGQQFFGLQPALVAPEEFPDPLRNSSGAVRPAMIACGFTARGHADGRSGVNWVANGFRPAAPEKALVAPKVTEVNPHTADDAHATMSAIRDFRDLSEDHNAEGASMRPQTSRHSSFGGFVAAPLAVASARAQRSASAASDRAAAGRREVAQSSTTGGVEARARFAVPLNRGHASDLYVDAERRIALNGFGSLGGLVASGASDEAVAHVLRAVGFGDAQRVAVMWEMRKARVAEATRRSAIPA